MIANHAYDGSAQPTTQQLRILRMLYAGQSYDSIARSLFISRATVYRAIRDLKAATGAPTLPRLLAEATRRGWDIRTA